MVKSVKPLWFLCDCGCGKENEGVGEAKESWWGSIGGKAEGGGVIVHHSLTHSLTLLYTSLYLYTHPRPIIHIHLSSYL